MKDGIKEEEGRGAETEGRVVGKGRKGKGKRENISSPFSRKKGRETGERETF